MYQGFINLRLFCRIFEPSTRMISLVLADILCPQKCQTHLQDIWQLVDSGTVCHLFFMELRQVPVTFTTTCRKRQGKAIKVAVCKGNFPTGSMPEPSKKPAKVVASKRQDPARLSPPRPTWKVSNVGKVNLLLDLFFRPKFSLYPPWNEQQNAPKKIAPLPKPGLSWKNFPTTLQAFDKSTWDKSTSESPESSWKIHPESLLNLKIVLSNVMTIKTAQAFIVAFGSLEQSFQQKTTQKMSARGKTQREFYDWGCEIQQKNTCFFSSCSLPCLSFCCRFKGNLKKKNTCGLLNFKLSNSWAPFWLTGRTDLSGCLKKKG